MSTETATDIAALVGEMEAPACEHSQHRTRPEMHGGPALCYVRAVHPCAPPTEAYVACAAFVARIGSGRILRCPSCLEVARWDEAFEVLGPVNK